MTRLLLGLEVVEQNATLLALFTPVADDDAGAVHDLAGIAFTINLAYNTQKISFDSFSQPQIQRLCQPAGAKIPSR